MSKVNLNNITGEAALALLASHVEQHKIIYNKDYEYAAPELLKQLVESVNRSIATFPDFDLYISEPPMVMACGCMGPEPGCTICPCAMRWKIYEHRYEILCELKKNGS